MRRTAAATLPTVTPARFRAASGAERMIRFGVVARRPGHRVDALESNPVVLVHAGERVRSEPDVVAA